MKVEYFHIAEQLRRIFLEPEHIQEQSFKKIQPLLKYHFIRIQVYFIPSYHQRIIGVEQKRLQRYLERAEYWKCADVQGNISWHKKRIYEMELLFQNALTPPQVVVNDRGLISVLLHPEKHERLINLLTSHK